jgi:hypothetical protein
MRMLISLIMAALPAAACSCVLPPGGACALVKGGKQAAIIVGRVTAEAKVGTWKRFTFAVNETLAGPAATQLTKELTVQTFADEAACGASFQVGGTYLVYVFAEDGRLVTDLCSGNKPLAEAAADLRYLRAPRTPTYLFGLVTNRAGDRESPRATWPVAGKQVFALLASNGALQAQTRTGEDGGYAFFGLPAGRYRVQAGAPGEYLAEDAEVDLQPGLCARRSFAPARMAVLNGKVFDAEGEPDATADLRLEPLDSKLEGELTTDVDQDGRFEFTVPPGRYQLIAIDFDKRRYVYPQELTLQPDAPLTIRFALKAQR